MSRYDFVRKRKRRYATTMMVSRLRRAASNGQLSVKYRTLQEGERLDHVAFEEYGDAAKWWIIAACSGIGWWLQCPEGTELVIPIEEQQVERVLAG